MRTYERPLMIMEEFVPNQAIASCETQETTGTFTCLQGPNIDTETVLADVTGTSCVKKAKRTTSTVVSKPSNETYGYQRGPSNGGYYVICVQNGSSTWSTSEWDLSTGVHADSHNGGKGQAQWHCMAAPVSQFTHQNIS